MKVNAKVIKQQQEILFKWIFFLLTLFCPCCVSAELYNDNFIGNDFLSNLGH